MDDEDIRQGMEKFGSRAMKGMGTDEMRRFIESEIPRWRDIIQRAGIKPE